MAENAASTAPFGDRTATIPDESCELYAVLRTMPVTGNCQGKWVKTGLNEKNIKKCLRGNIESEL